MMHPFFNERCFLFSIDFFGRVRVGLDRVLRGLVLSFYLVSLDPFVSSFLKELWKQICGNSVLKSEIASLALAMTHEEYVAIAQGTHRLALVTTYALFIHRAVTLRSRPVSLSFTAFTSHPRDAFGSASSPSGY